MTTTPDLHAQLEAMEKRIAKSRARLTDLNESQRHGLGAALESLSEAMDRHENPDR